MIRYIAGQQVRLIEPLRTNVVPFLGADTKSSGWLVVALTTKHTWFVVRKMETEVEAWRLAALTDTDAMLDYNMYTAPTLVGEPVETIAELHRRVRRRRVG